MFRSRVVVAYEVGVKYGWHVKYQLIGMDVFAYLCIFGFAKECFCLQDSRGSQLTFTYDISTVLADIRPQTGERAVSRFEIDLRLAAPAPEGGLVTVLTYLTL
jgi:hypothetical protein